MELATHTLPPRDVSRAIKDYAATKQRDLEVALAAHHANFECQQRWLTRFEARDPTFAPWLEDNNAPSSVDISLPTPSATAAAQSPQPLHMLATAAHLPNGSPTPRRLSGNPSVNQLQTDSQPTPSRHANSRGSAARRPLP
ncbi:hypothetical protein M758_UG177400 [Ceratodon purpureus]|nr:hypothetical protein M758_UG177400 [Ceratodon purpureus]